jgi:hypothetical protein
MPPSGIDIRTILIVTLRAFAVWAVAVVFVTFVGGQPGVVCLTPMAWLLALRVGLDCAAKSRSMITSRRVLEGALSGALLGFLQGVLFALIVQQVGDVQTDERVNAAVLNAIMLVGGIVFGSGLAAIMALRISKLREKSEQTPA